MLTKGAIGNLVNRYRAVLKKCNLMNTFGSLAVASMLVMGGAGVAEATSHTEKWENCVHLGSVYVTGSSASNVQHTENEYTLTTFSSDHNEAALEVRNGASAVFGNTSSNITITGEGSNTGIEVVGNMGSSEASKRVAKLAINGKLLSIKNVSTGIEVASRIDLADIPTGSAYDHIRNATKDARNALRSVIDINVDKLEIKNTTNALSAMSSGVLNVNKGDVDIDAKNVLLTRGSAITNIGAAGKTVKLKGDITFNYDGESSRSSVNAEVNLTLSGENSSWEGASTVTGQWSEAAHAPSSTQLDVKNLSVSLADGARWIPTVYEAFSITDDDLAQENGTLDGRIAVNNVTLDEGVIVLKSGVEADVENLSGKGDVRVEADGESMGTLTAANAANATLDVQAADADGNALNADQTDVETLKKVKAQVKAEGAAVTASAAEGDVNGAISIDANGNVSTAKNTLMDAALKQASITTVALDKILTNDVRKRLGDIRSDKNQTGVWMRWDGGKLKGDGLTNNFNTIQIGGDTKVGTNCRIGVAGSFTHGDTDFARGNGELEGFSFALYSTWMGENGMFADIVTRLGHFSNEMNVEGRKGDMDNRVFSLSGEYGWRFDLCKQFFLEPQVELAYTYVSSDDLQLGTARYAFDNVNSLVGRAGLVAGWNLPDDMGSVYARASVLQQFMGDAKISGSNGNAYNVQEIDGNDTWMEYGIGANVKLTDKTYIWADVERTAGADLDEEWRGTVGLRYSF